LDQPRHDVSLTLRITQSTLPGMITSPLASMLLTSNSLSMYEHKLTAYVYSCTVVLMSRSLVVGQTIDTPKLAVRLDVV
jgi:hypothetical protein